MTTYKPVDVYAAAAFANLLTGFVELGMDSEGNIAMSPESPKIRAHLQAALGIKCPSYFEVRYSNDVYSTTCDPDKATALASYLRGVADYLEFLTSPCT